MSNSFLTHFVGLLHCDVVMLPSHGIKLKTETKWKALLWLSEDTHSLASSVANSGPRKVRYHLWSSVF